MFGKVHPPLGIHVYEVDIILGLEPGTVKTGTEVLVELILLTGTITVGIFVRVKLKVLPPLATIWGWTYVVPGASKEAKGLIFGFCMLFGYVKRGLRLSNDSFTSSITRSERCNRGFLG